MRRRTPLIGAALAAALVPVLAACTVAGGGTSSPSATVDPEATVVVGTTEPAVSLDPAATSTVGSSTVIGNIFQTVLTIPAGETDLVPQLGSCDWADALTYTCTIDEGNFFSTGREVTAQDVAGSMQRVRDIASETGSDYLLVNLDSVSAEGDTVTYTLLEEDNTFPYLLTTLAGRVVDIESMSTTEAVVDYETVIGSGPYMVTQYTADEQVVLEPNPSYEGPDAPQNGRVIFQFFQTSETLRQAIAAGTIDVAYRQMSPADYAALEGAEGVETVVGEGVEMRYQSWNPTGGDGSGAEPAVRQAVAQIVDRAAIADLAYADTVQPLHSLIPAGIDGHTESFSDAFGEPDVEAAVSLLADAGVETPVPLTIGYSSQRYGSATDDEMLELQRQLQDSELFDVTLVDEDWAVLRDQFRTGSYDMANFGWFGPFPDATRWTIMIADGGYNPVGFDFADFNAAHHEALKTSTTPEARAELFATAQQIVAEEVPIIPLWQADSRAVVRSGIGGVEETLDTTFQFRTWSFTKTK